jgi:predicted signal transduction protein with EAL and GGDEF domain
VEGLDSPEAAARVGQRILDVLTEPIELGDRSVSISASIGIATADDGRATADALLGRADVAMYRAKRDGKSCYRVFESFMHTAAIERLDLEQDLRRAVVGHELTVQYQPVVETDTGRVVSFEALARWNAPGRGAVPPDVFIPLAEEIGLILDIGRSVLVEACCQAKIWHVRWPDISPSIAVNVSGLQLVHPGFVGDVAEALAAAGLDASSLTLEITESILSSDPARVIAVLNRLRLTGVRIAIDDFGTGYSSLAALAELPVDELKIDKRFIDRLLRDNAGRGLVEAITRLAGTLGLDTVAEGVELPDQLQVLRDLGCRHIQGYLFARPLSPVDTYAYLENEARRTTTGTISV